MRTVDQNTARLNYYCQVIIVLLVLCVIRLWSIPSTQVQASANGNGVPDSGAQRQTQIAEARRTNELLQDIEQALRVGPVQVRIADESASGEKAQSRKR